MHTFNQIFARLKKMIDIYQSRKTKRKQKGGIFTLMEFYEQERFISLLKEIQGDRSIRGIAQSLRSEGVDIAYHTWRAWVKGESCPNVENMQKIAHIKGWTLEQLMAHLKEGVKDPQKKPLQYEQIMEEALKLPKDDKRKLLTALANDL